jgi:hypothetical protein
VNWGDGAGRAPAVREPPPNFIECMRKTAGARTAAGGKSEQTGKASRAITLHAAGERLARPSRRAPQRPLRAEPCAPSTAILEGAEQPCESVILGGHALQL